MTSPRTIAVIDIGKTNAKVALVDLDLLREIEVRVTPNNVESGGLYPHFAVERIWKFVREALSDLNGVQKLDAISVTTHGASAALIDDRDELALPVLDYEYLGPEEVDSEYQAARPDFRESFTPHLPGGLNLGKQLFWQARRFPGDFDRVRWILPYPQYWGFRLTGVPASELTSLGCHTDLWDFQADQFSSLVKREGWSGLFAPMKPSSDVLGSVSAELAEQLGLSGEIPVYVGIHDSNASLLPYVLSRTPPYAVVSTGTWVVVFAPGGDLNKLNAERDSFSNIDAFGHHVPSARFMGGREYSELTGNVVREPDDRTVLDVLRNNMFILPSIVSGCGPFPRMHAQMPKEHSALTPEAQYAVVSFYLAMMTSECLDLAGAAGDIVVEGPFASNKHYLEMLAAATCRQVLAQRSSSTGTSIGAAMLAHSNIGDVSISATSVVGRFPKEMVSYAQAWRAATQSAQTATL